MSQPAKKRSFRALATREGCNKGARMTVDGPDGKPTEDWLHILGVDSDAFQAARRAMQRSIFLAVDEKGKGFTETPAYTELQLTEQRKLSLSVVTAWSFDEPCTPENVASLIQEAPYVGTQIDVFMSNRVHFVAV